MSSITVQQDPESFIWAVSEPLNGVHRTIVTEADAREAAGALQVEDQEEQDAVPQRW